MGLVPPIADLPGRTNAADCCGDDRVLDSGAERGENRSDEYIEAGVKGAPPRLINRRLSANIETVF